MVATYRTDARDAGRLAGLFVGVFEGAVAGTIVIPIPLVGPFVGAVAGGVVGGKIGRAFADTLVKSGNATVQGLSAIAAATSGALSRSKRAPESASAQSGKSITVASAPVAEPAKPAATPARARTARMPRATKPKAESTTPETADRAYAAPTDQQVSTDGLKPAPRPRRLAPTKRASTVAPAAGTATTDEGTPIPLGP